MHGGGAEKARQQRPGGHGVARLSKRGCSSRITQRSPRRVWRQRRRFAGDWPEGRRHWENYASGAVLLWVRALECRSAPLSRSDRRATGGTDEREQGVRLEEKAVYTECTMTELTVEVAILVVGGLSVRCRGETLGGFSSERQLEPRRQPNPDLHPSPAGTPLRAQDYPFSDRPAGSI